MIMRSMLEGALVKKSASYCSIGRGSMSSRKRGEVKYGSSVQYSASVERLHAGS